MLIRCWFKEKALLPYQKFIFIYCIWDASLRCISEHLDLCKHPRSYFLTFFILLCFRMVRFQKSLLAVRIWDSVPKLEEVLPPPCPHVPAEPHPSSHCLAFHHSCSSMRCPVPSVEDHQGAVQGFSGITDSNALWLVLLKLFPLCAIRNPKQEARRLKILMFLGFVFNRSSPPVLSVLFSLDWFPAAHSSSHHLTPPNFQREMQNIAYKINASSWLSFLSI